MSEGTPRTRPERSDFKETTRYEEILPFLLEVQAKAVAPLSVHIVTIGYTTEGRSLYLAVIGHNLPDGRAETVRATNKLRFYAQGDIHAGENAGKEALLKLMREFSEGKHTEWFQHAVFLFLPMYNADGAVRINLFNRPLQHGAVGGMGTRETATGLNLNRDYMKLDCAESRSMALFFSQYDPHVQMDLHVTNGSQHAYHLTYSAPMYANTDPELLLFLRSSLLPTVTSNIRQKHNWEYFYYGNVSLVDGAPAWVTFSGQPRYSNNYAATRNRCAILSEAYSYITFEQRIECTFYFVTEVITHSLLYAETIKELCSGADAEVLVGRRLVTRSVAVQDSDITQPYNVLMGATTEQINPYSGATMLLRRDDVVTPTPMYVYGSFAAASEADTEIVPAAYFFSPSLSGAPSVIDRLNLHGAEYSTVSQPLTLALQQFIISDSRQDAIEYEGHRLRTIQGAWSGTSGTLPAGTIFVPMTQPLVKLLFSLFEPRSDDGFCTWNFFDADLGEVYPVVRSLTAVARV
eukprot:TRINITY_DN1279_c0_g1_i2.p1 TRINITY_DN1279_c0_g1~~TRINITY_DN1279_c0_g1_i2.p1  ORF type:complete len:520 (-),score=97.52 TRINITY_DN1279_c0_g1_i2:32-1591(-)